jgi:hypothetical protein
MSNEIIESIAYDDFQHVNFIFAQNFISLFWGLFNDKTDLRVRYWKEAITQNRLNHQSSSSSNVQCWVCSLGKESFNWGVGMGEEWRGEEMRGSLHHRRELGNRTWGLTFATHSLHTTPRDHTHKKVHSSVLSLGSKSKSNQSLMPKCVRHLESYEKMWGIGVVHHIHVYTCIPCRKKETQKPISSILYAKLPHLLHYTRTSQDCHMPSLLVLLFTCFVPFFFFWGFPMCSTRKEVGYY